MHVVISTSIPVGHKVLFSKVPSYVLSVLLYQPGKLTPVSRLVVEIMYQVFRYA